MDDDAGAWGRLEQELDSWGSSDAAAALWWRDDDATAVTRELERLLELQSRYDVPLCLAVIPEPAEAELAARLESAHQVHAAVHGYRHLNHAPGSEKKAEFGAHRPLAVMESEIAVGWEKIQTLFGGRAVPVFVPPWNRMTNELSPQLPNLGLRALSRKALQHADENLRDLNVTNVHVDITDWRGTRGFIGDNEALTQLSDSLRARRMHNVAGPAGLLTHHAVMDEPSWHFLERLFAMTGENQHVRWLSAPEAFNLAA